MGVSNTHILMYGVIYTNRDFVKKIGEKYEMLDKFLFDGKADDRAQIVYDGMNSEYVAIGMVCAVDPDEPVCLYEEMDRLFWILDDVKEIEKICGISLTNKTVYPIYINHYH